MPKSCSTKIKAKSMKWGEPVSDSPSHTDVLLGRGNGVAHFAGNINFRRVVWAHRENYRISYRNEKAKVAQQVIDYIAKQNPPGRFLEKGPDDRYYLVPYDRVIEKTCQALREKKNSAPVGCTLPKVPPLKKKKKLIVKTKAKRCNKLRKIDSSQFRDSSPVTTDDEAVTSSELNTAIAMDSVQIAGVSYNLRSTKKTATPLSKDEHEGHFELREETAMQDDEPEKSMLEVEDSVQQLCGEESILDRIANQLHDEPDMLPLSLLPRQSSSFFSSASEVDKLEEMFSVLPPRLAAFSGDIHLDSLKTHRFFAFDEGKETMKQDISQTTLLDQDDDDIDTAAFLDNLGLCNDGINMIPSTTTNSQGGSEAGSSESRPSSRCVLPPSPANVMCFDFSSRAADGSFQEEIPKTTLKPTHSLFSDEIEDCHDVRSPGATALCRQYSLHLLDGCLDTF